jgi:hypothetical protein
MATVQLIGIRPNKVATVQRDGEPPVEMTWSQLHEAQQQDGVAGYVYRWLMFEFCRCEFEQRQGRAWQSPRREVAKIVVSLRNHDAREAAEAEASHNEKMQRQDARDRQRAREQEIERVEAARHSMSADSPWWPIPSWEVPKGIRFDTLRRDQGQIVEYSYGTFGRAEARRDDPYMAVVDHHDGSSMVYKRRNV